MKFSTWAAAAVCVAGAALIGGCQTGEKPGEVAKAAKPPTILTSYSSAKALAAKNKKPLFIKFTAEWCGPCKEMEKGFSDPRISPLLDKMVAVEVDIDKEENEAVVKKYHPEGGIPYVLILRPDGSRISDQLGYESISQFEGFLKETLAKG